MLRKGITVLLTHSSKQRKQTVCCNQITLALNINGGENTSCLDSANSLHNAGYTTVSYQVVRPGKVSLGCFVPSHIERPSYVSVSKLSRILHNSWLSNKVSIEVKSQEQIRGMRDACRYDCCCCYCYSCVSTQYIYIIHYTILCSMYSTTVITGHLIKN